MYYFFHLFSLTYYSFFLPFWIKVRNPLFIRLYIHIIHILFFFYIEQTQDCLIINRVVSHCYSNTLSFKQTFFSPSDIKELQIFLFQS